MMRREPNATRRRTRLALAVCATVIALAALGGQSFASSGAITRAFANDTWTSGSVAGNVTWTDCPTSGTCQWIPVLTAQPSLPEYSCRGDEIIDSDPNTRVVWNAGGQGANGTVPFDLTDALILNGVHGQRLCLSVLDTVRIPDAVCIAQAPILGYDPATCTPISYTSGHVIATTLMTVPPPAQAPPTAVPLPGQIEQPQPKRLRLTTAQARRAAAAALWKRFGKVFKRGRRKNIDCARKSTTKELCVASWRYAGKHHHAVAVVKKTSAGTKATIRRA